MNAILYLLGIVLQAVAALLALWQVPRAPRRLPWLLIAVSSLLIVVRRAATLGAVWRSGAPVAGAEVLTLLVSALFFVGVLLMARMFKEVHARTREQAREAALRRLILDSSPSGLAVLDPQGRILAVNEAWRRFGRANGLMDSTSAAEGADYLTPLRGAALSDPEAGKALAGLEAVLAGTCGQYTQVYACHGPDERRWFRLRAWALASGEGVVAIHDDVSREWRLEQVQAFLARGEWLAQDQDFFQAAADFLGELLDVDRVVFEQLTEDARATRVLATWPQQDVPSGEVRPLRGRIAFDAVGRAFHHIPEAAAERYPQDPLVRAVGAQAFAAATLWGPWGQPVGLLSVVSQRPLSRVEAVEPILALMAARATGELERRAEEAARRLSEAQLEQSFEASAVGLVLLGLDFRIHRANAAFCALLGRPAQALEGLGLDAVTAPEDRAASREAYRNLLDGRCSRFRLEKRYLHRSGHEVWGEVHASLVRDSAGKPLHFIAQVLDISDRRLAEQQRTLTVKVLEALNRKGEAAESASAILGIIQEELGVEAAAIRLAAEDDFTYAAHRGFPEAFIRAENCLRARTAQGEPLFDADGTPLFECTCGLVLTGRTDSASPLFTEGGSAWTNDALALLDIPPGQDPRYHPRNRCMNQGYRSLALVPVRSGDRIVGMLQLNDPRPGRFSKELVVFLEGLAGSLGIALARRQAREQERVLTERLFEARRMDSLGRLAGGVAHEINNALASILGLASAHISHLVSGDPMARSLDTIMKACRRARDVVRGLMVFARRDLVEAQRVDLNRLVREAVEAACAGMIPGVPVELNLAPNLPHLQGDAPALAHALLQVILNAAESGAGRIVVTSLLLPGGGIRLTVEDTGAGMDAETLARAAEPFFSTKPQGQGLGLAMVFGILQAHGGALHLESAPGSGTRAHLDFPVDRVFDGEAPDGV